ncbi:GMC oxidoreductase-domain-containing protein [Chiua virens]|nr:GMC oxidoreductase-domain-containing protein [Chiua virens]
MSMFDIIFAGGGTTACVIAGRLTTADPVLKILIIESGQHSRDNPCHVQPCRYVENIAPDSTTVSFHVGKSSAHLNGRAPVVPCGRTVGGGSAVNFMMYVRGSASDYDDWAALGNEGWGFDELLPLIRKIETFTPIPDRATHGYSGPIGISAKGTDFGIGKQFLEVGKAYDPDRPQVDDTNDFKTGNAYGPAYRYVDPATGKRCDTASRYLYPHSGNPNVVIMVGKRVKRIIIENGRAVGVEYTSDAISDPEKSRELITAKATKLVVVSGGAFGSPSILERSGIGSPRILAKHNVDVLVDLPGVGENYMDHYNVRPVFHLSDETETMDDVWRDSGVITEFLKEWEVSGKGKIAYNGIEAMLKMRPTAAELASAGPALQLRWETFFQNRPDKPMAMIVPFSGFRLHHSLIGLKFISVSNYILYPEAIGHVHITSREDANAPLDFDPESCSKPGDVALLTLLYKMTRERVRRMPAYRGEVALYHPQFPAGSPAACKEEDDPVPISAPDIAYSEQDEEAIVNFIRNTAATSWHSLGTCAMKPRDQGGVVDARLNVYGVEGLKVADLSICPTNVGNNTYSTALLIGEKAAAIIAEDLGVKLNHE